MVSLVQEAYGRLGEEAEHTLTRLAVSHSRMNRRRGLPPGNTLNNMRVRLDGALHTSTGFLDCFLPPWPCGSSHSQPTACPAAKRP